jgi:hypothetical protein
VGTEVLPARRHGRLDLDSSATSYIDIDFEFDFRFDFAFELSSMSISMSISMSSRESRESRA